MKAIILSCAAIAMATILAAAIAGYPLFAQTATAAFHEGSTGDDAAMDDTGTAATAGGSAGGATVEVAAGSNATVQYYTFTPRTVEINAGESVTWSSPAELSDIHTVTFALDENLMSDVILSFGIPEQAAGADFELLPPYNVGEPFIAQAPDGREAIVAANKVVFYPTVIGADDETTFLEGTDIEYTIGGTEKVVNSGIVSSPFQSTIAEQGDGNGTSTGAAEIPYGEDATDNAPAATAEQQGGAPPAGGPPFPLVSSFTATFEEPGTYPYFCGIHPWMTGEVVVRGDGSTGASTP